MRQPPGPCQRNSHHKNCSCQKHQQCTPLSPCRPSHIESFQHKNSQNKRRRDHSGRRLCLPEQHARQNRSRHFCPEQRRGHLFSQPVINISPECSPDKQKIHRIHPRTIIRAKVARPFSQWPAQKTEHSRNYKAQQNCIHKLPDNLLFFLHIVPLEEKKSDHKQHHIP